MENLKTPFVEEIEYTEIELLEIVGKGSFGVVNKGKWRGKFVAVKKIEGESEKKAFLIERHQLSRVNHPNIVKLYGACTKSPVCLVMEYAEGGSLYSVLHVTPRANYTAAHAMSWALQCARGVSYLHDMKPKALIHRDLKPPNLLLIMGGTVLKICDFGTACDIQTHMTNNKGSAAWMAPEVFEGCNYSEKCDVFSWGIILWEILTRHKPFAELGATAFSIMWAVHTGNRPPLIQGCPLVIEKLMSRCWDKNPQRRPPMSEVVEIMTELFKYFKGADEPITFSPSDDEYSSVCQSEEMAISSEEGIGSDNESINPPPLKESPTKQENELLNDITPQSPTTRWAGKQNTSFTEPISVQIEEKYPPSLPAEVSIAPTMSHTPSITSSQSIIKGNNFNKPSADFFPSAMSELKLEQISVEENNIGPHASLITNPAPKTGQLNESPKKSETQKNEHPINQSPSKSGLSPLNYQPPLTGSSQDYSKLGFYNLMLEPQYQPLPPLPNSTESMKVFEEHNKLAQEYIRVQAETSLLLKRRQELNEELGNEQPLITGQYSEADKYINEMLELQNEKQSLETLYQNLKRQLEILKQKPKQRNLGDDWVMLP